MGWEYVTRSFGTNALANAQLDLNELGADGWEVCGFAAPDRTLGFNAIVFVLKRETPEPPAPIDRSPAWGPDPLGKSRLRWWNGIRWTKDVAD